MSKSKLLRALAAFALSAFAITAAFALSVDQTRIIPKRVYQDDHPVYYRVTINWNDPNIKLGQQFATLGNNDFVKAIDCHVTVAFNAGSTNVITFGVTKLGGEVVASGGITPGSTGVVHLTTAAGLGLAVTSAGDVPLFAAYTQTGTAATAGAVTCVIEAVPNNDN
jgi:hypothetical protein